MNNIQVSVIWIEITKSADILLSWARAFILTPKRLFFVNIKSLLNEDLKEYFAWLWNGSIMGTAEYSDKWYDMTSLHLVNISRPMVSTYCGCPTGCHQHLISLLPSYRSTDEVTRKLAARFELTFFFKKGMILLRTACIIFPLRENFICRHLKAAKSISSGSLQIEAFKHHLHVQL
jgi:hypothetical protein